MRLTQETLTEVVVSAEDAICWGGGQTEVHDVIDTSQNDGKAKPNHNRDECCLENTQ